MNWPEAIFGSICVMAVSPCVWVWWFRNQCGEWMKDLIKLPSAIDDEALAAGEKRNDAFIQRMRDRVKKN